MSENLGKDIDKRGGKLYNDSMEYTSLYRKYRPKTFDEVIGQDHIVRTLRNMVQLGSVSRTYLFTGPRGNGKTSLARIFARAINCQHPNGGSPCLECEACKVTAGACLDIIEMDAASNNGVEDVRQLKDSVQYPPADPSIKYKVYIIDEVHQLSGSAFNALLKTLEEPPAYCVFILATTEVHKLPQTILSRCIRFDFRLLSQSDLAAHVAKIYDKEGVAYTQDATLAIARAGNGSVRDTLSVADTCMLSAGSDTVTYESVLNVLGANNPMFVLDLVEAIFRLDLGSALSKVEETVAGGKNISVLARDISQLVRDLLIIKSSQNANQYLCLPTDLYNKASALADSTDKALIMRALGIFSGLDSGMRYSSQPRFMLEKAVADCCMPTGETALDVAARIAGLENKVDDLAVRPVAVQTIVAPIEAKPAPKDIEDKGSEVTEQPINMVAVDNPFGEEIISNTPTDETRSGGNATVYKGEMIKKLREAKLFVLYCIFGEASTRVYIKDKEVTVTLSKQNDCDYCELNNDKIISFSKDILGFEPNIKYKYYPPKQTVAMDESNLAELIGAGKITKK